MESDLVTLIAWQEQAVGRYVKVRQVALASGDLSEGLPHSPKEGILHFFLQETPSSSVQGHFWTQSVKILGFPRPTAISRFFFTDSRYIR